MRKGFVFSLDAIVVLGLVLMLTLFLAALSFTYSSPELRYQRLYYTGKDLLNVIENAKLGSVQDNPVVQDYLQRGILIQDDMNKTILDAIGSLWAEGNLTEAANLTNATLSEILNGTSFDYELLIDGQEIHEKNTTSSTYLARLSAIVSGYDTGMPVSGYSARVRISKANKVSSAYLYFGGYVGDGNITADFILPQYDNILNVSMEMNAGDNLSLYVNGNFSGMYTKSGLTNISAEKWSVDPSYYQYFTPGPNNISINFMTNQSMYIGGGYLKVTYNTSQLTESNETFGPNATMKESLPRIDGIINLYSSFYVPGNLKNMSVLLHYNSNYTVFMTIGNQTVYEGNSSEEGTDKNVTLNSTYLSGLLDYSSLSSKTTPFRVGLFNVSYLTIGIYGIGDPVVVTDLSGSMADCALYGVDYCRYDCRRRIAGVCTDSFRECPYNPAVGCQGTVCGTCACGAYSNYSVYVNMAACNKTKLDMAKEADKTFVDIILNESYQGNRVGLVGYSDTIRTYTNLTSNETLLNNTINGYNTYYTTCICCGINRATNMSRDLSNSQRKRINVVMTDGIANVRCTENQATADLNGDGAVNASDDAINASCVAYQNYGIITYTVGFGENEADVDNLTLNKTAECGHGKYFYSNVTNLAETFQQIAIEVINASYQAQTVEVLGHPNISMLYPDSYIQLNYSSSIQPTGYGEVMIAFESPNLSSMSGPANITDNATQTKEGWYYIPEGLEVTDAKITSYSSNFWTDRLYVNSSTTGGWQRIYWLGDYGINYTGLGDPFVVNVPLPYVAPGNNSIRIGTGLNSSGNGTGASGDDRIIYTLKIDGVFLEEYSRVFPKGKGSTVTVYYDYNGDNVYDGYSQVAYGPDPSDIFDPENDSVDDSFMGLMDMMNFIMDANPSSYGNGTAGNPYDGINQTNPVDLQITSDVAFDTVMAEGIPSLWGPAVMEIRIWS
jgi:hypothetical protein